MIIKVGNSPNKYEDPHKSIAGNQYLPGIIISFHKNPKDRYQKNVKKNGLKESFGNFFNGADPIDFIGTQNVGTQYPIDIEEQQKVQIINIVKKGIFRISDIIRSNKT